MIQSEWSHLPNAKYIDWVFKSASVTPMSWALARNYDNVDSWTKLVGTVRHNYWADTLGAAWHNDSFIEQEWIYWVLRDRIGNTSWDIHTVRGAFIALIAYDDCGYMIESDVGELKLLAKLGDPRAILLLPACKVFNETKALI